MATLINMIDTTPNIFAKKKEVSNVYLRETPKEPRDTRDDGISFKINKENYLIHMNLSI